MANTTPSCCARVPSTPCQALELGAAGAMPLSRRCEAPCANPSTCCARTRSAAQALRAPPGSADDDRNLLRVFILAVDRLLRRYYGIREFSDTEDNLLRISTSIAEQRVILGDGTEILPGDAVIDLHLWNERIPGLGPFRSGLGWGSRVKQRIERSLAVLAAYVEATPSLMPCRAIRADAVFPTRRRSETLLRIAARLGFDGPGTLRPADPGHTLLAIALGWVCHPGSPLLRQRLRAARYSLWMSRRALRERYLSASGALMATVGVDQLRSGGAAG